jgi:hypothetical protein
VTSYGLDGPGFEPQGEEIFRNQPVLPRGPVSLLYSRHRVSFVEVKRSARRDNPPLLATRWSLIYLHLYCPSMTNRHVMGWPIRDVTQQSVAIYRWITAAFWSLSKSICRLNIINSSSFDSIFLINPHLRRNLPYEDN